MHRWLAVMASTLLLAGCTTAVEPPAALSGADLDQWLQIKRDSTWLSTGLPASERPDVQLLQFVSNADYFEAYARCMNELDASDDQISIGPDGELLLLGSLSSDGYRIADYTCTSSYVVSPEEQGYYSTTQLEAAYDYFATWLVPCLAGQGFVVSGAPTRAGIASRPGYLTWNPYQELPPADITPELLAKCVPYPPFMKVVYY